MRLLSVTITFATLYDCLTAAGIDVGVACGDGAQRSCSSTTRVAARSVSRLPVTLTLPRPRSWPPGGCANPSRVAPRAPDHQGPVRAFGDWPELSTLGEQLLTKPT